LSCVRTQARWAPAGFVRAAGGGTAHAGPERGRPIAREVQNAPAPTPRFRMMLDEHAR